MAEKTAGQWVGTIVGAVAGFFTGGATWYAVAGAMVSGASIGSAVGGMLDPPKGPHLEGPRLNDLSVQSASYGAVIPRVYGTAALLGNVFWIENNQIKETATTESQGGKGGGGGTETTSYSYSATFAVGLCEGEITGVRRIWVGSKLIYDASATDISTIIANNLSSLLFTLYKGTDTQLPDDRMQAALGVANTPAYRGLAYIVFKDFPLADHGNSMLGVQVKVEVVKNGTIINYSRVYKNEAAGLNWGNRERIVSADDGLIRTVVCGGGDAKIYNAMTGELISTESRKGVELVGIESGGDISYDTKLGNANKDIIYFYGNTPGYANGTLTVGSKVVNTDLLDGRLIYFYAPCADNRHALIGTTNGAYWYSQPTDGAYGAGTYHIVDLIDYRVVSQGNCASVLTQYAIGNFATMHFSAVMLESDLRHLWWWYGAGTSLQYPIMWEINNAGDLAVIATGLNTAWTTQPAPCMPTIWADNGIMYAISGRAYTNPASGFFAIYRRGSLMSQSAPALSNIVQAECLTSNLLTSGDIDVTALTQSVRGYRVSSVAAIRAAIEPLQGAWPFDVLQSGYKIKFKPRGGSVVATIPASDLDARERSKAAGNALVIAREMDSIIPRRVVLKHMDVDREYDQGEQYAERLNTDAVNIQTVEMALVMTSTEAAGMAEVLLYLYWLERYDISFSLPPTYNGLEPADVITINTTYASYQLRLTSVAYTSDGRLECSAKYNSAAIYTPTALGESGQSTGQTITLSGSSSYALLDIPLLLDATDLPGFPVAMTGYLAGWSGGSLFRTDDLGQTWSNLQSFTAPGAVMGSASATIGAGRLDLIDTASVLPVYLTSGDLSSITEAQLLGGANHFAYGVDGRWEIIGAQNCILQGDGSYLLSKLLRGRFGSEWACGLHQPGDRVVLLDSNRLKFLTANLNSIGQSRTYRAITSGKSLSSDSDLAFSYTAVNLECLAPVYLNGSRHPATSDWSLTWLRRTRVGGEWRDYVDATLGETSEAYELEIYSSAAYTTLKRTLTGLSSAAAAYTSAQQVTDFGSNQATLYVKVYQLSAVVGRGYPLTTSITR